MADGRTVTLATKVSPATARQIDAKRGALSRSAWISALIDAALEGVPAVPVAHYEVAGLVGVEACTHPREKWKVIGGGAATMCECGARVR